MGFGAAVFCTDRSVCLTAGRPLTDALLLPVAGFQLPAVIVAVLLSVPSSRGLTVIWTLTVELGAIVPMLQVTVCAGDSYVQDPWDEVAAVKVTSAGRTSTSVTFVAEVSPVFVITG